MIFGLSSLSPCVWPVAYKKCMRLSSPVPGCLSLIPPPPKVQVVPPIMPGGAFVTGEGIGANAPGNVWTGILSVHPISLSTLSLHALTIVHPV